MKVHSGNTYVQNIAKSISYRKIQYEMHAQHSRGLADTDVVDQNVALYRMVHAIQLGTTDLDTLSGAGFVHELIEDNGQQKLRVTLPLGMESHGNNQFYIPFPIQFRAPRVQMRDRNHQLPRITFTVRTQAADPTAPPRAELVGSW